jgi:hypothetical protein
MSASECVAVLAPPSQQRIQVAAEAAFHEDVSGHRTLDRFVDA